MTRPTSTPESDKLVSVDLPVAAFSVSSGSVALHAGAATIETPAAAGAYAAQTPLPASLNLLHGGDPALLRILLKVERGAVDIGVLNRNGTAFVDRKELKAGDQRTLDVLLGIPRLGDASEIVVMGAEEGSGRARIERITLTIHPSVPPERMLTVDLPLNDFVKSGGHGNTGSAGATFDTPAVPGEYVAQLALPSGLQRFYSVLPALVRARLRLERGSAAIGVLSADGTAFLDRHELRAVDDRPRDVILGIHLLGNASDIVLMGSIEAGRVRVESLSLSFYTTIPRNGFSSVDLPLSDLVQARSSQGTSGATVVETPAIAGAYGARLDLPSGFRLVYPGDPALVSIRLKTVRGTVGVGLLDREGTNLLDSKMVPFGDAVRTVYLAVDNIADASSIVFHCGPDGVPGRVQIESVAISL